MKQGTLLKLLALAISAAVSAPLASAGESPGGAKPLRVGVTPSLPPMVFKQGRDIVGIEADFARELGVSLGRPVQFVELKWADQIPALLEGRTDIIMSSLSITRPRQFRVAFSEPWFRVGQMGLIRGEDSSDYGLGYPFPFRGTIGVLKGTVGDFLVRSEYPGSKRKEFKSGAEAAKALLRKRIDLFISDSTLVWWLAGENEAKGLATVPILLSEERIGWAVRKDDADLLSRANAFLKTAREDGRFKAVIKRWLPQIK